MIFKNFISQEKMIHGYQSPASRVSDSRVGESASRLDLVPRVSFSRVRLENTRLANLRVGESSNAVKLEQNSSNYSCFLC